MTQNWLENTVATLTAHAGLSVIVAASEWGAPYVFERLREQEDLLVWLELTPEDEADPVAQGNKLSNAVTRTLHSQLFGNAMPYSYGLSILRDNLALFEPITFILSGADYSQALAQDLAALQRPGCRVILSFYSLPTSFEIPETALVLQATDLKMTPADAAVLAENRVTEVEVNNLYRLAGGAYETFMLELHKHLGLPVTLRPGPEGSALPPGANITLAPTLLLQVYMRRKQWMAALETACHHVPERAADVLEQAGDVYMECGLYERLWQLLASLPDTVAAEETVLYWKFRAAARLGTSETLRAAVEAHLARHEAPELRAYYASKLATRETAVAETERAYHYKKTFVTVQHYAAQQLYTNPERSLDVYKELVTLSQRSNVNYQKVVALAGLAHATALLGRYRESSYRCEEALRIFDLNNSSDWQLRAHIISNWAYSRCLLGETVGLNELLQKEERALRDSFPALAFAFRSTLGDYMLSQGRTHEALHYHQTNLDLLIKTNPTQGVDFPVDVVLNVVKVHLHLGDTEQARRLAEKFYYLNRDSAGSRNYTMACLSYGMVLSLLEPAAAIPLLETACRALESPLNVPYLTGACLYLCKAQLNLNQETDARATLKRAEAGLTDLSDTGFTLMSGSLEDFNDVYNLWRGTEVPLKLSFLGEASTTLEGKPLGFSQQCKDILALLALHPEGISLASLVDKLYEGEDNSNAVKVTLSKMRRVLPVTRPPYQLELPFQADFIELEKHLRNGKVRAGLELYRGPLLPKSKSPGIIEAREVLEETLRQAVLDSGDAEALLNLSERLRDDLELWEATLAALPSNDPRRAIATAKHKLVAASWGL